MNIDVTISIHALLAESDYSMGRNEKSFRGYFYPRSPCGERLRGWTLNINGPIFLSTLSLRRATPTQQRKTKTNEFLSTLSLRRATDAVESHYHEYSISIHALLAESDTPRCRRHSRAPKFLSTLSLRRATTTANEALQKVKISIHALLAESDLAVPHLGKGNVRFLSTLSLRRATGSVHRTIDTASNFYPRSPCGERLSFIIYSITDKCISIHALLAESDVLVPLCSVIRVHFYPRSPCGERRIPGPAGQHGFHFYPRSPCGERR